MTHEIRQLNADDHATLARCFGVFTFLRPHLSEERFIEQVRAQAEHGYRIIYIETEGAVAAAAGYRIASFLAWGRILYIDDLITHPEMTRRGFGGALLDWLKVEAKAQGCAQIHLDTGPQRHDAHRLYLNKGFVLAGHHMAAPVV